MALKDIRPFAVPMNLDHPRTLVFDLNAFAVLEEKYGNMDAAFHAMQSGSMKAARTLLWAGLLHEDETLTERQVGSLVTLANIESVMGVITQALNEALPETESDVNGLQNHDSPSATGTGTISDPT